jgi:hypothetical protein
MAKTGGGNFLLEKGEKVGLGIGAGLGVLFIALGLMALAGGGTDPDVFAKGLDNKASQLKSTMDKKDAIIPPANTDVEKPVETTPLPVAPTRLTYFDPTAPPDGRRITPIVLRTFEGQVDMAVLKILANDFVLERDSDGNVVRVRVGVVSAKDDTKNTDAGKFIQDVKGKLKNKMPGKRNTGGGIAGGPGFPGGPGGGFPGGPPGPGGVGMIGGPPPGLGGAGMIGGPPPGLGGAGMIGGPPPGPGGGGNRGDVGGPPGPGGGFPGMGGGGMFTGAQSAGNRLEVQYIEGENDEEIEKKMEGRRLAITLKPQRMNVLQGSFPYRAQLAKYQAALRYAKIEELYAHPDDMPVFNGVDVQRRLYRPKSIGSSEPGDLVEDWTSIELATNSQDLRAVKLFYNDDPVDLRRVMLHEDHMLAMPLPHEIAGKYPEMKLDSLKKAIEKMKKQDAKAASLPPPKSKFLGEGNPFRREEAPNSNLYNPGGEGSLFPGMGGKTKGNNKEPPGATTPAAIEPPDYIYVRVYDTDVRDGMIHAYRMRVKLKNPNYNKHDLVSKKSDADTEELPPLEEHWYEFPQKVSVPQGGYTYLVDWTKPDAKASNPLREPRDGQAVLQFQRWYEYLDVTDKLREPVGDWVLSELLATRGMYVTGKAFAPLPFWSSIENSFVLREIPGEKVVRGKDPRKGVMLEPVRPKAILAVEIEGGKVSPRIPPNPGQATNRLPRTEDEAATEMLFMYQDGTLEVKSSARDRADTDRKEREEKFRKWVKETEDRGGGSTAPPKKKDDF